MLQPYLYKKYPILFVDDEEPARFIFQLFFHNYFSIYTARDGEEALNVIKKYPEIILILSDQRMPRMDGIKLFKQVAQEYPTMINILVTAYADPDFIVDAMEKGNLFRFIKKPYEEETLKQAIIEGIEQSHLIKKQNISDTKS